MGTESFPGVKRPGRDADHPPPSSDVLRMRNTSLDNTPIHNILSTAPQLSISQNELGTLPEDGNVVPKHAGATIHN
jgi:hypothetical protein